MKTRFSALVLCGMLASCTSITTKLSDSKYRPRPPDCKFTLLVKPPAKGFAEVGEVKVEHGATGGNGFADLLRFKNQIRSHVCRAGGDAVLAISSDSGVFVAAKIWKQTDAPSAKEIAAAPAAKSRSAKTADAGCHEDEQCEGDQLCIDGKCADPSAQDLEDPSEEQAAASAPDDSE